ncbi:MAG: sigma-E factor negative regulatory protein [Halothiobacillaceae bacterium]
MLNAPKISRDERVSAAVDGELPDEVMRDTLDDMEQDAQLRAMLGRYHLVGQAMRSEIPEFVVPDLSQRVMAAIEQENAQRAEQVSAATSSNVVSLVDRRRGLWPLPAGMAVAASILVAAFVLVPAMQQQVENDGTPSGLQTQQVAASTPATQQQAATLASSGSESTVPVWAAAVQNPAQGASRGMDPYVMTHFEQTARGNHFGSVMPGARLANFQVR